MSAITFRQGSLWQNIDNVTVRFHIWHGLIQVRPFSGDAVSAEYEQTLFPR